jgi:hypothetical protein
MRESAVSIGQLDAPFRGILFIIAGISIFSIQDVVIKWISGDYSVHQILFVRSVVALVPLFVIVRLNGGLASCAPGGRSSIWCAPFSCSWRTPPSIWPWPP